MKKLICMLMAFLISIFCLTGCSLKPEDDGKINIVTTVFPPFDFARAIAGDKANITQLVRPGGESHSFEPTPSDIKLVTDCDLFLMIGGESESWAERISSAAQGKKTVVLSEYVIMLESGSGEHHDQEAHAHHIHSHHHEHDEHIWTSPENAIKMSEAVCDALCEADAKNSEYYKANLLLLKEQLTELSNSLKALTDTASNKLLVFGDRFPFLYLTSEYGFSYVAAFPGCAEQTEPDIKTLTALIERVNSHKIPVVFYTEFSSRQTANMICEETGAEPLLLHSCHNITKEEAKKGETYVSLMKNNIENLKKALK